MRVFGLVLVLALSAAWLSLALPVPPTGVGDGVDPAEVWNKDGSIRWEDLIYLGRLVYPLGLPVLPAGIFEAYRTPSGDTLVIPSSLTTIAYFALPEMFPGLSQPDFVAGNGHVAIGDGINYVLSKVLGLPTVSVEEVLKTYHYESERQLYLDLLNGQGNIWTMGYHFAWEMLKNAYVGFREKRGSAMYGSAVLLLDRHKQDWMVYLRTGEEDDAGEYTASLLLNVARLLPGVGDLVSMLAPGAGGGADRGSLPGGGGPGASGSSPGAPGGQGPSRGPPAAGPPLWGAGCPAAPQVEAGPARVVVRKVAPEQPVVVGQDPGRRGVDILVEVEVPGVVVTRYTRSSRLVCQGFGGPQASSAWCTAGECRANCAGATHYYWVSHQECHTSVEVLEDPVEELKVTLVLRPESVAWIEGELARRYPAARVQLGRMELEPPGGWPRAARFSYLFERLPLPDPGVWEIVLEGRTHGTAFSRPRALQLRQEFPVWLLDSTLAWPAPR